tara:strand:+ start:2996 stop:3292 length:297 start_codon:yes stop_codon:yes gene_type:complete
MAAHKHSFLSVCGRAIHLIFLFQSHKKDIVPIPAARNIQLQPNVAYSFFFFRGQDLQGFGNLAGLTLPALGIGHQPPSLRDLQGLKKTLQDKPTTLQV